MALIPAPLVANPAFRKSFAATFALPAGVLTQLVAVVTSRESLEPQEVIPAGIDRRGADEATLKDALRFLTLIGSQAATSMVEVSEGRQELEGVAKEIGLPRDFTERLRELDGLFDYKTPFARHSVTVAAFGEGPTYSSSSFEPTLRIWEARGRFLAVPGIQSTFQFFDSDGDIREFSFGMTAAEANTVAARLAEALGKLQTLNSASLELYPSTSED